VVNIYKYTFTFWHRPGIEPGTFDPKSDTVTITPPPLPAFRIGPVSMDYGLGLDMEFSSDRLGIFCNHKR